MFDREEAPVRELTRLIEARIGHVVPERNIPFLEEAVRRRVARLGLPDLGAYVELISTGNATAEWGELLRLVLVHESYLFRGARQIEVLIDELLPGILEARAEERTLTFWSAGCSRGEEAVSLAILLAQRRDLEGWNWQILATDIDPAALHEARRGIYEGRTVREVSEPVLRRYFERVGEQRYRVRSEILDRIDYRELNLVREPLAPPGAPFDVILIRNVLIYFRPESQKRVVESMARLVAEDGYIVPGPSESLWQIVDTLEPVERKRTYFYRRRSPSGAGTARLPDEIGTPRALPRTRRPEVRRTRAVEKSKPDATGRAAGMPKGEAAGTGVRRIVEALLTGKAGAAREALEAARREGTPPAIVHALEGVIAGSVQGEPEAALVAYRKALFLEPGWYQLRLELADLLHTTGDLRRAAVEYRRIVREAGSGELFPLWEELGFPPAAEAVERARRRLRRSEG